MKTIYKALLILLFATSLSFSLRASDQLGEIPIGSTAAPSESVLQSTQRSLAATGQSAMVSSERSLTERSTNPWDDALFLPDNEVGSINVVGGPVGDATIPIVLFILIIYLIISKKYKILISILLSNKMK